MTRTHQGLSKKTPRLWNAAYVAPRFASIALYAPLNIVQGIYAKHYGMALTSIALIIFLSRIFDAVSDPVIGYLSDKHRVHRGSRKPFMIAGAIILGLSAYFLYRPPENVTALYFGFWFISLYLGFTLFEIPHLAWGGEIAKDSKAKRLTYNLRTSVGYGGLVMFYTIPMLPIWETSEITPETLRFFVVFALALFVPLIFFSMKFAPDGAAFMANRAPKDGETRSGLRQTFSSIIRNKPLKVFLLAFIFAGTAMGMWLGMVFIYIDIYLQKGEYYSPAYLIALIFGVGAPLLWAKISQYTEIKNIWRVTTLVGIATYSATAFVSPEVATFGVIVALMFGHMVNSSCLESLPKSLLSDIVDYTTLKFRIYRGSTYFALFMFIFKGMYAVGGALGLYIAGRFSFDATAAVQSDEAVLGLKIAMVFMPVVLALISLIFISRIGIGAREHAIITKRLELLERRRIRDQGEMVSA